jgi:murein L,D-transpeptidase YafK
MSLINLGDGALAALRTWIWILVAGLAAGCAQVEVPPYLRPLSKETMMLLGQKGMKSDGPIFVRIFKEESELEIWKMREDGHYYHFKTYPICNWSGDLGPKTSAGDRQAPEGFYRITRSQMNPSSQFHLAFNLGYPNAYDRALGRTGEFLMVHGKCKSAGCYAMTDGLIEEIYALSREAFIGGQEYFEVHAFPFRMTAENMARYKDSPNYKFWLTLKEGYDYFELTRQTPSIAVCERRYLVNAHWLGGEPANVDPNSICPAYERVKPEPFTPVPRDTVAERTTVPGPKMRTFASAGDGAALSGLTNPSLGAMTGTGGSPASFTQRIFGLAP